MSAEQEITDEDVAQAIFNVNNYRDPDINYLDLLRDEKYAELDKYFDRTESAFASGDIYEYQYIDEYKIFKSGNDDDLFYFDKWLTSTTDKRKVLIARGLLYDTLGWDARGRRYAKHVSDEQFGLMEEYFNKSFADHHAVLEINKKSLISYTSMLTMAATSNFSVNKHEVFKRGIKEFPSSHVLAKQYMYVVQPKWGGSYREVRRVARSMRKQAINNPMLISLGNLELHYRKSAAVKQEDDVLAGQWQRFSLLYGVYARQIIDLALHYDNKNDNDNALKILSYGLRLYPTNTQLLVNRAYYYSLADNFSAAAIDLDSVTPDEINIDWLSDRAADTHDKLKNYDKAIQFYTRTIEINPKWEYPYNRLYWMAYKEHMDYRDVLPYLKQWTDVLPQSSDAWISYASTLKKVNKKASIPAYKNFIKYANRNSSIDMNAIRHTEKFLKLMEEIK